MAVAAGNEGVLILHGFTGSPWEVRPVAERLASTGRSIAMPVLAGHGTDVADLDQTTWHDWLASAMAARAWLDRRCDTIHVVGLSMGGLLAVLVANDFGAARLGSLTLLAPAFTLGTVPTAAIKTFHTIGWPKVLGKDAPVLARNERPPAYWQVPVAATNSLLDLISMVRGSRLAVSAPTLVVQGTADATIPHRAARRIAKRLVPHARFEQIPRAGHLLPRVKQAPAVLETIALFVRSPRS